MDLHGAVEEKSWKTILDNLRAMIDTTNEICNNVEDPQVRRCLFNFILLLTPNYFQTLNLLTFAKCYCNFTGS